jgi:drug/metabolite transporter (DMT)-like permease
MIGSLCYAFNAAYLQKYHSNSDKIVLIGWSMLFGGFFMIPLASFNLPNSMPDTNSILALFWLAVISTGVGYLAYVRLIDRIGAVKTVTLTYLLPVFSIIWGAIFLKEQITFFIFGGFIFVMMGMYFANTSNKSKS